MKFVFFILIALASPLANAGREAGGSKAIVCPNAPAGKQARLLDYYRGETEWGLTMAPVVGRDEWEMVLALSQRLSQYDIGRAGALRAAVRDDSFEPFKKEMRMVDNANFTVINDSNEIAIPEGCHLEIIVNQKVKLYPDDKKYRVNGKVWALLPAEDRAGAIVHEIYYGEALKKGAVTADDSAYLNAILASAQFETMGHDEYYKRLNSVGLPVYVVLIDNMTHVFPGGTVDWFRVREMQGYDPNANYYGTMDYYGRYEFESPHVKGFRGRFSFPAGTFISYNLQKKRITRLVLDGEVKKGESSSKGARYLAELEVQGKNIPVNFFQSVEFENGLAKKFTVGGRQPVQLKRANGKWAKIEAGWAVEINERAEVIDVCSESEDTDTCESYAEYEKQRLKEYEEEEKKAREEDERRSR